jgi:hypothetical protein
MWTFTFKELLGVKDTRKRWNRLLTAMKRTWPELQGIRVFEMHKRHGLHVHMVTNERIDVVQARALAEKAGWGRIHVTVMPAESEQGSSRLPQALEALGGIWRGLGAHQGEGHHQGIPIQHRLSGL